MMLGLGVSCSSSRHSGNHFHINMVTHTSVGLHLKLAIKGNSTSHSSNFFSFFALYLAS